MTWQYRPSDGKWLYKKCISNFNKWMAACCCADTCSGALPASITMTLTIDLSTCPCTIPKVQTLYKVSNCEYNSATQRLYFYKGVASIGYWFLTTINRGMDKPSHAEELGVIDGGSSDDHCTLPTTTVVYLTGCASPCTMWNITGTADFTW